jgi:hypothetical protein
MRGISSRRRDPSVSNPVYAVASPRPRPGRTAGCEITAAPWDERYAGCADSYGYAWKFFRVSADPPPGGLDAGFG